MMKKPTSLPEWRIIRIKSSPAAYVGHVRAADEKEAIRKAIQEFQITNPEVQKRLVAQRGLGASTFRSRFERGTFQDLMHLTSQRGGPLPPRRDVPRSVLMLLWNIPPNRALTSPV